MPTYIIAEAGVNHNGSLERAKQLVDVAVEAGADAVKFQTFRAASLVTRKAPKARYQTETTEASESQWEMLRSLELPEAHHHALLAHCSQRSIQFLSTPFDVESADLLARLGVPRLKIPSGEITNGPFLLHMARLGKPIILSTGMSTLGEVEQALGVLAFGYAATPHEAPSRDAFQCAFASAAGQAALRQNVVLLHCTTEYPTPFEDVNLYAMDTMRAAFGLPVGFSDHTPGVSVPIAAVARGAVLIEKHFTLDRTLPGPDHQASLEPDELMMMVCSIREVERALGTPLKRPAPSEMANRDVARKSLVATRAIQPGELFTEESIGVKRIGEKGLSPMQFWSLVGREARRAYRMEDPLEL